MLLEGDYIGLCRPDPSRESHVIRMLAQNALLARQFLNALGRWNYLDAEPLAAR